MSCVRLSLPPTRCAPERTTPSLWAPRCARVWVVGAALGELVRGSRKKLPARMDRSRATSDGAVLGHPVVAKALVVLVLDPDNGRSVVRRLSLADPCRSALQQVRAIAATRSSAGRAVRTSRGSQWRNSAARQNVFHASQ